MKPYRMLLAVMTTAWLFVFYTPLVAQQAVKGGADQRKTVEGRAEEGAPKATPQPLEMDLVQRGDRLYLKLSRPAKGLWLDKMQKGAKSLGQGKFIEVTPYVSRAKGGKLTFAVLDMMGQIHTRTFAVHPYASRATPEKAAPVPESAMRQSETSASKEKEGSPSQQNAMTPQRPPISPGTAAHIDTTPPNQSMEPAVTRAKPVREMAEDEAGRGSISGLAQTHAPRVPKEPDQVELAAEGIVIQAPAAGTQVRAGEPVRVQWEYDEHVFEEYRDRPMSVDLYARSVEDPTDIVWTFRAGSDREVDWHIPSDTPPGLYVIGARFDSGTTVFTGSTHIEVLPSGELVLVWPPPVNPGETTLYVGYNYPITWNAYGDAVGRPVDIKLMDGDALFRTLAAGINPPSERYEWLVGGNCSSSGMVPRGDNFRIQISSADDPAVETLSAAIHIRLPSIDINVRPRAGERWRIGDSALIVWNSDHVPEGSTVKLSLLKGGSYYLLIDENQPNGGSYLWTEAGVEKYTGPVTSGSIAQRQAPPDDDYSIHIEMEDCGLVYGASPVFELFD